MMKFVEKNEMEEIVEDFMYSDGGLTITLNENGNIDTIIWSHQNTPCME